MKTIASLGRDGSPQPSEDSSASRPHQNNLFLKNRAFQRSASSISVSSISPLPRRSIVVKSSAFTLLEVLVATAVLALMLAFLFNLIGASTKLWESGNKKIEASQAARVALNIMADDLKNAVAGNSTTYTSLGTPNFNMLPFLGLSGSNLTVTGDLKGAALAAPGSDQLFGIRLTNDASDPFDQFGYQCVYVTKPVGFENMRNSRYYLVSQKNPDKFYFNNISTLPTTWYDYDSSSSNYPIIDNCIRLTFKYYGNQTSSDGNPTWSENGSWSANASTAHPPLGVLVTISVLDSKTAERISALGPLTDDDITLGLSASNGNGTASNDIQRFISQGSVTMSRFIPLPKK